MFTTLAVCRSIGRENSSLNALAFAALAILVANTNALFDIGFQLSFLAVLAILLWEPQIRKIYTPTNRVAEYLWGITTVSLSAQLGTAPLVMLNFANYSTYFLLTNFIVIPLMFVIVFVSVLMLIFSFMPIIRTLFVWILTELVTITNRALSLIVDLPYSSLSVENVSAMLVCCLYLSMLFVYLYLIHKKSVYLLYLLSLWAIWSLLELYVKLG
jgi:competence protein ComEC